MKPIIGIFGAIDNERTVSLFGTYSDSIESNGALPILFPYTESAECIDRFVSLCHGFFFTGGVDIDPSRYGERTLPECGSIQPFRDRLEFAAFEAVYASGKPILGICRGAQLINVALGGSLYQDIPSQCSTELNHRQTEEKFEFSHSIKILEGTPLRSLTGKSEMRGNSFHHQAVKSLAPSLRIMARAEDGIVEGFYEEGCRYLRAYQWHPERLYAKDGDNRKIFTDFIESCRA